MNLALNVSPQNSAGEIAAEQSSELKENPISGAVVWSSKSRGNLNTAMILFTAVLLILVLALLKSKQGGSAYQENQQH